MLRLLFASDSFKGSISSARAAELFVGVVGECLPTAEITSIPIADGGEGTAEAVVATCGGELVRVSAHDPLGRPIEASFALLPDGRAVVETAAASGLPLLTTEERNPLLTSTYGTGELVLAALDAGATDVTLALGGSATNDGGMGLARALGAHLLDTASTELTGIGADLGRVASIDLSGLDPRIGRTSFTAMCDVANPLLGPQGATYTFGLQKGATPTLLDDLERGMRSYADALRRSFGEDVSDCPGAGAAGGLGAAAMLLLRARLESGIERMLDLVHVDDMLCRTDLVITGEGHADGQSVYGKAISGIAAHARAAGVPCVALVGGMDCDAIELLGCGVTAVVPTVCDVCTIDEAIASAERTYKLAAARVLTLVALGMNLGRHAS